MPIHFLKNKAVTIETSKKTFMQNKWVNFQRLFKVLQFGLCL